MEVEGCHMVVMVAFNINSYLLVVVTLGMYHIWYSHWLKELNINNPCHLFHMMFTDEVTCVIHMMY